MNEVNEVIEIASKVDDGLRHLRNFAKKRRGLRGIPLLSAVYQQQKRSQHPVENQQQRFGLKQLGQDTTEIAHLVSEAYRDRDFKVRRAILQKAEDHARQTYQDEFIRKMFEQTRIFNEKQLQIYKQTSGDVQIVDKPAADVTAYLYGTNDARRCAEAEDLMRKLHLNEQLHFSFVVRGQAEKLLWPEILKITTQKNCPVPYVTVGEILYQTDNKELACDTFRKIGNNENRIEKLIEYRFWTVAMDEIIRTDLYEDFEHRLIGMARAQGESWVISEWHRKRDVAMRR